MLLRMLFQMYFVNRGFSHVLQYATSIFVCILVNLYNPPILEAGATFLLLSYEAEDFKKKTSETENIYSI